MTDKTNEIREQMSDEAVGGTVDDEDGAVLTLDEDDIASRKDDEGEEDEE